MRFFPSSMLMHKYPTRYPTCTLLTVDPSIGLIKRDQSTGYERACDPIDWIRRRTVVTV